MNARRLAWSALALVLLMFVAAVGLGLSTPRDSLPGSEGATGFAAFALVYLAFCGVGAVVASRQPGNPIGWLFVAFGLVGAAIGLAGTWAVHSVYVPGSPLPGASAAAWLESVLGALLLPPLVLIVLLFPDGRLLTSRWRIVVWLAAVAPGLMVLGPGLRPGPLESSPFVENPLAVEGAETALDVLAALGLALAVGALIASAVSLVLRFRRSRGHERQQLKWFATGAAFAAVLFGGVLVSSLSESLRTSEQATEVTDVLVALAFTALPVAAGVAILRHRLYDIDVVINRTLVYGALTATLLSAYLGSVLLIQLTLSPLTADSDLAIAGSTLAVAALFRPARRRIQEIVDRRFFRRRYDAARTLERFGARLRDEVELDSLSAELRAVVADTMQPAHVSLWLRKARP